MTQQIPRGGGPCLFAADDFSHPAFPFSRLLQQQPGVQQRREETRHLSRRQHRTQVSTRIAGKSTRPRTFNYPPPLSFAFIVNLLSCLMKPSEKILLMHEHPLSHRITGSWSTIGPVLP